MLEKLYDINWASLTHAYGQATDVPELIKALMSQEYEVREKARWELYGNIFHQGTRYQATPYAVPFLLELVASEEVRERERIILYLIHLALGYEEEFLLTGFNVEKYRKDYKQAASHFRNEIGQDFDKYGHSPKAILEIYDEVQKGVPLFQELLFHPDTEIKKAAIYALTWFPDHAQASIAKINELLKINSDKTIYAEAILSKGFLAKSAKMNTRGLDLEKYLGSDSRLLRVCSAISLARSPMNKAILDELLEGLIHSEKIQLAGEIYFYDGYLAGYTCAILAHHAPQEKANIAGALIEVLKNTDAYHSLAISFSFLPSF
jgi:hypothetical protein